MTGAPRIGSFRYMLGAFARDREAGGSRGVGTIARHSAQALLAGLDHFGAHRDLARRLDQRQVLSVISVPPEW